MTSRRGEREPGALALEVFLAGPSTRRTKPPIPLRKPRLRLGRGRPARRWRTPAAARLAFWKSRLGYRPAKVRRLPDFDLALELGRHQAEQQRRKGARR